MGRYVWIVCSSWHGTFTHHYKGYDPPQNLKHYAFYLDSRIRAYRDLKHDAIRVQSESNRDMRISQSADETLAGLGGGSSGGKGNGGLQRSKTLAGRKLRVMTVEKGLLRETKAVQRTIDALLACQVRNTLLILFTLF